MEKLNDKRGVLVTLEALRFLRIRLLGRPATRALAEEVAAAIAELLATDEQFLAARDERMALTAEIAYLDEALGDEMLQVGRELRALTAGQTDDPRFVQVFPVGPAAGMTPVGGEAQARFVANAVFAIRNTPSLAGITAHADSLEEKARALAEAEARRAERWQLEARTRTARGLAQDKAQALYNRMLPRLQLLWPDDRRLVESMFYRFDRPRTEHGEPTT